MNESPDPGWRDADRTRGLDMMVEALDHFDTWKPLQATRRVLYRTLRPRPGAHILDAGCGTGIDVATLASRVLPGGEVHGMDLSERMVALARERHGRTPGVTFSAGSVRDIPFPDARFDATFAMRTVQYVDEPLAAIREMARVTKPGGRIAVVEGGMCMMNLPTPELAGRIMGTSGLRAGHSFGSELYELLRRAGLKRVRVVPVTTIEHEADSYLLVQARHSAESAQESGVASAVETSQWLAEVEARAAAHDWFNAECFFIAVGTVPAARNL